MAQIIKQRRGSITQLKDVTARVSELVVATGSIGNLNGPFLFVGETEGVAGAYRPISKIYQGASAPTIAVGSYGSVMDGTPFYASGNKSLYILSQAGNSIMDFTGNIEGNTISNVTITSLTGSNANYTNLTGGTFTSTNSNITSLTGSNGNITNLTGSTFTSTNANITSLTGSNAFVTNVTGGTLTVTGTTNLNGDLLISGNIIQTGSIDLTGNVRIGGNITVGDANTDFVSFGADISSSIVPDIHNAFDLGSSDKNWRNLHVSGTAYVDTLQANQVNFSDLGILEDLTVSGNTFLGNGGDTLIVSGSAYYDTLTDNRVVIAGTNGLLEDDANFTFNGTQLNVGVGNFTVQQSSGNVKTAGTLTVTGSASIGGNLTVPNIRGYNSLFGTSSSDVTTFVVTVSSKTSNHRYFGTGSGSGYFIDGIESPFLTLLPGKTYRFSQSDGSNSSHQILFYYDAAKTIPYVTNVTTNGSAGSAGSYTQIVVTDTTPIVLHYQCVNHPYMGNSAQFNSNVLDTPHQVNARNGIIVSGSAVLNNSLEVKGATSLNSTLTVTGSATLKDNLSVSGTTSVVGATTLQDTLTVNSTSELKGAVGLNSTLDVTGSAILKSTLQVNSTSELKGAVGMNSTLDVTGSAQFKSTINVDSEATLASATVEDLTQDRIVTVGAGGSLIDSSGFTYNGTVLKIGNGQFEVDTNDGDIRTSGSLTVNNGVTINGNQTVNGVLTVTGNTQLQSNLYVSGNLEVLGSATNVIIQSQTIELDDNIIRINAYSPFERYAGFEVIDSGSSNTSASLLWDSANDYWMFMSSSGQSSKLIGTTAGTYGSEVSLTDTYFPIATGTNTIGDSLLRYSGTSLSFNTNKFTVDSGTGDTLVSGNFTLSYSGGTDTNSNTSAIMFRNSSNVVGFVSTTETEDVLDGILGYKNSNGGLVFSTVIDGGTY